MGLFFNGNQGTHGLVVRGGNAPALFRDWGTFPVLDHGTGPAIEFSRGSTATFTGSNGLIQSAATNAPRFDYDPITLACRGLLIEESRTNLLTRSEEFDNAVWVKQQSTITANAATAPDGTTTADKLVENTTNNNHFSYPITTMVVGTVYTYSVYARASERSFLFLQGIEGSPVSYPKAIFNLSSGTISLSPTQYTTSITNVGNGWYRCSITFTADGAGGAVLAIGMGLNATTLTYTGDGTSGIFLWGAQLEAGAFATSYIPTTTASVTRATDVAQISGSNFSGMYNQDQGTLYAVAERGVVPSGQFPELIRAHNGSISNQVALSYVTESLAGWFGGAGGIEQFGYVVPASTRRRRVAGAFTTNSANISVNGGISSVDGSVTPPTGIDRMFIGWSGFAAGSTYLNGTISQLAYYRTRLTDAQLQALTA